MEILESLKSITESTTFDGAIAAIKRIMDVHGEISHINTEIIHLDEINQLARMELDSDETYGWTNVLNLLSDIVDSNANWYKYDCGTIQNFDDTDIDNYVREIVKELKSDILYEIQESFDTIYDTICDLAYAYELAGDMTTFDELEEFNTQLSAVSLDNLPVLIPQIESIFTKGLEQFTATEISDNLPYTLILIDELKNYQDFLN